MSVLNTRNVVFATCGAVLGCASAYAYGGANQLVALAGAVGAVALPAIYAVQSTISRKWSEAEMGFEAFSLDITPYKSLGSITNKDLMAHKSLGEGTVCSYLRKMDLAEFEQIKKEHLIVVKACELTKPAISGGVGSVVGAGLALWMFSPLGAVFTLVSDITACLLTSGGIGANSFVLHTLWNRVEAGKTLEDDRANRLSTKIHRLSDRRSTVVDKRERSAEAIQLGIAQDCFQRTLQRHTNTITIHHT